MFYGRSQYDPIYIIAQIASIQAIFYVTLGALLWVLVGKGSHSIVRPCCRGREVSFICKTNAGPYAGRLTLSYIFSSAWLKIGGWMVVLSSLGTAVVTAISIAVIVRMWYMHPGIQAVS